MIAKDDMMGVLLAACPSFAPQWQEFRDEWRDEAHDLPLYLVLADFARHLIAMVEQRRGIRPTCRVRGRRAAPRRGRALCPRGGYRRLAGRFAEPQPAQERHRTGAIPPVSWPGLEGMVGKAISLLGARGTAHRRLTGTAKPGSRSSWSMSSRSANHRPTMGSGPATGAAQAQGK